MSQAFLDIETSWDKTITVIGIYRAEYGTRQLIAPHIDRERLLSLMDGVETVYTYNGACFDLPVIEQFLGVDLKSLHIHRDLLHDCRRLQLRGGLKAVERKLGIHRDTEGVDGLQAMRLWAAHRRSCASAKVACLSSGDVAETVDPEVWAIARCRDDRRCDPLDLLLRYNKEDVENLAILARKLSLIEG
jgi:uncharacterized protein